MVQGTNWEVLTSEKAEEVRAAGATDQSVYPSCKGLAAFQQRVFAYFTCYTFAAKGLVGLAEQLPHPSGPDQHITIGVGPPERGIALTRLKYVQVREDAAVDGRYSSDIAKALLVLIYAEWEHVFRSQIGSEFGANGGDVKCDLMGDLRIVRNWIAHKQSVVGRDAHKLKVLKWTLVAGDVLAPSKSQMENFMREINAMIVSID